MGPGFPIESRMRLNLMWDGEVLGMLNGSTNYYKPACKNAQVCCGG